MNTIPEFKFPPCSGPSHAPRFRCEVSVSGLPVTGTGQGSTKKQAKNDAASDLLSKLGNSQSTEPQKLPPIFSTTPVPQPTSPPSSGVQASIIDSLLNSSSIDFLSLDTSTASPEVKMIIEGLKKLSLAQGKGSSVTSTSGAPASAAPSEELHHSLLPSPPISPPSSVTSSISSARTTHEKQQSLDKQRMDALFAMESKPKVNGHTSTKQTNDSVTMPPCDTDFYHGYERERGEISADPKAATSGEVVKSITCSSGSTPQAPLDNVLKAVGSVAGKYGKPSSQARYKPTPVSNDSPMNETIKMKNPHSTRVFSNRNYQTPPSRGNETTRGPIVTSAPQRASILDGPPFRALEETYSRVKQLFQKLQLLDTTQKRCHDSKLANLVGLFEGKGLVLTSQQCQQSQTFYILLTLKFEDFAVCRFIGKSQQSEKDAEIDALHNTVASLLAPLRMKMKRPL